MGDSRRSYEETRARHREYAFGLLPEYITRLGSSRAEIRAEQRRALRGLVRHALERSPWHRERLRHLDVDALEPEDLRGIPAMTKQDLMANWDSVVTDPACTLRAAERHLAALESDAYFLDEYHVIASGGSSGTRGVFAYDWHGWAVSYVALARFLALAAIELSGEEPQRFVSVSAQGASHATSAISQTFSEPDRPLFRVPVTQPLARIVEQLYEAQPSVLHAYASVLPTLCAEAKAGRLAIRPRLVWSTSEPLFPEVRALVEEVWGVPVLNGWAASETNGGAFACLAGGGFHVAEDVNAIEPVDENGAPVAPGERSAKVYVTNFYNELLPLIRYEISDEFLVQRDPCACGSSYVKVSDVQGRADDSFRYAGGVLVHPLTFRSRVGREPAILEYQVRQTSRGADIQCVTSGPVDLDAVGREIASQLAALGLAGARVGIRRVESLARQSTGKLKRFVPMPDRGRVEETA